MRFGVRTDTQDLSGEVLESMPENKVRMKLEDPGNVREAVLSFVGEISQIPPMYSALKVDGMKLVNAARKGVTVERKPRKVTIYSIRDIVISPDLLTASFEVHCSTQRTNVSFCKNRVSCTVSL